MGLHQDDLNKAAKNKKLSSFQKKFRKGFSGKSGKTQKPRTKTTGQKLVDFFKGK